MLSRHATLWSAGVSYEAAMDTIHSVQRDGTVLMGPTALRELYKTAGLGWAAQVAELPVISSLFFLAYSVLSKYRFKLSGSLDSIAAAHQLRLAEQGVQHCTHSEEECEAPEW